LGRCGVTDFAKQQAIGDAKLPPRYGGQPVLRSANELTTLKCRERSFVSTLRAAARFAEEDWLCSRSVTFEVWWWNFAAGMPAVQLALLGCGAAGVGGEDHAGQLTVCLG